MKYGSLFSGACDGLSLGFEWACRDLDIPYELAFQVEIDPWCRSNLTRHWPSTPRFEDVQEVYSMASLKKMTPEGVEKAVALYVDGKSIGDIADIFGLSRQGMWDLLRRRTPMRSRLRHSVDNHFYRGGELADEIAHNKVETAIEQGVLQRPESCQTCGASGRMRDGRTIIQAHHCDYNKPLEVMWLCQKCHHNWHKSNTPIARKEVPAELSDVQVIVGGFP